MGLFGGTTTTTTPTGTTTTVPEGQDRETYSQGGPLGIFVNAFRDLGDMAKGIAGLGGAVVHDIGSAVVSPFSDRDFVLDDMWGAITGTNVGTQGKMYEQMGSAFVNDYQERYSGNIAEHFYEHPLSFISDALTVATAGGFAASQVASAATKLGMAGDVASGVAKAGEIASAVGKPLSAAARAAEAAGIPGGALAAKGATTLGATSAEVSTLGKFVTAVKGAERRIYNPITHRVEVVGQAVNPARRILYQNRLYSGIAGKGGTTRGVEWIKAQADGIADELDAVAMQGGDPTAHLAARAKLEEYRTLVDSAIKAGATEVYRVKGSVPGGTAIGSAVAKGTAKKAVDLIVGQAVGKTGKAVEGVEKAWDETLGSKEVLAVAPVESSVDNLMGMSDDLSHDGNVARRGMGTRRAEQLDDVGERTAEDATWSPYGQGQEYSNTGRAVSPAEQEAIGVEGAAVLARSKTTGRAVPVKPLAPANIKTLAEKLSEPWGGATIDPVTRKLVELKKGFAGGAVVNSETITVPIGASQKQLTEAIRAAETKFADDLTAGRKLGVFRDEKTGLITIEPTVIVKTKEEAEAVATHLGAEGGFYDFSTGNGIFPARKPGQAVLPAEGTAGRAPFDKAVAAAQEHVVTVTQRLQERLGKQGRVTSRVKSANSIRRKAGLLGGDWTKVRDIGGVRIVAEDAWEPGKLADLRAMVEEVTGGRVRETLNSIGKPEPGGERGFTMHVEMPDGNPLEFQVLTPRAAKALDASTGLRTVRDILAIRAKTAKGSEKALVAGQLKKAIALSQHLWEGVTDELRTVQSGGAINASEWRIKANDFRVANWSATTDRLLLEGGLSIDSVFDNAYMAMRYQHGAKAGKLGLEGGPSALELDQDLARAGEMAPMYYPHMAEDTLPQRGQFLERKGGGSATSPTRDVNLKRNTGELLRTMKYSKNAREVFRVRAAQTARMQERMDAMFDMVQKGGRPLRPGELAGPGEVEFAPSLVKRLVSQHNQMLDSLAHDPSGKDLSALLESLTDSNADTLSRLIANGGDIERFAIPKVMADRLRQHSPIPVLQQNGAVDILFGTPQQLWRSMTLSLRPAWMTNNLLGNVSFLKLQGGKLSDVARYALDSRFRERAKQALRVGTPDDPGRVTGGMYAGTKSLPKAYDTSTLLGSAANRIQRSHVGSQSRLGKVFGRVSSWTQSMNNSMEDAFRVASGLTEAEKEAYRVGIRTSAKSFWTSKQMLEDAARVGVTERGYGKIVDGINKYMNDYSTLGPLERNIIKPYIAPFYSFYKHSAKLLFAMPFDHPAKAELLRLISESDQDRMRAEGIDPDNLPGWLAGGALFTGKDEAGQARFLGTGGINPFNGPIQSPVNLLGPAWKMLYEQKTGRSLFTGQDFTDPNVVPGGPYGGNFRIEVGPDGKPMPVAIEGGPAPGLFEHLLQQVPQYDMVKDLIAGGSTYDTSTLLDAIRFRLGDPDTPVPTDPETGEPFSPKDILGTMGKLLGYTQYDRDLEADEERAIDEKAAALKAWLKKNGIGTQAFTPLPTEGA